MMRSLIFVNLDKWVCSGQESKALATVAQLEEVVAGGALIRLKCMVMNR